MTLSEQAQPVVAGGKVFIGSIQGGVYGVNYDDGTTLLTGSLSGGTCVAAAVSGTTVVWASITGNICGFSTSGTGSVSPLWTVQTNRVITAAPLELNGMIYVADHGGVVPPSTPPAASSPGPSPRRPRCRAAWPPAARPCTSRPRT